MHLFICYCPKCKHGFMLKVSSYSRYSVHNMSTNKLINMGWVFRRDTVVKFSCSVVLMAHMQCSSDHSFFVKPSQFGCSQEFCEFLPSQIVHHFTAGLSRQFSLSCRWWSKSQIACFHNLFLNATVHYVFIVHHSKWGCVLPASRLYVLWGCATYSLW